MEKSKNIGKGLWFLQFTNPPTDNALSIPASNGYTAVDDKYFYVYYREWKRCALSVPLNPIPIEIDSSDRNGVKSAMTCYDKKYFYVYRNGWKCIAFSPININLPDRNNSYSTKQFITDLRIVPGPMRYNTTGQDGNVSVDDKYFYVFAGKQWRKFAISTF